MTRIPDAIFVIDPKKERICVAEAHALGITLIGIGDTNCDPEELDYIIPGNDDAIRAVKLLAARWQTLSSRQTRVRKLTALSRKLSLRSPLHLRLSRQRGNPLILKHTIVNRQDRDMIENSARTPALEPAAHTQR